MYEKLVFIPNVSLSPLMQTQYLVSHWGSDVNSLGSYSYDTVGKPHDMYDKLRIHVDDLFFAWEAISYEYPGFIYGSYSNRLMAYCKCKVVF